MSTQIPGEQRTRRNGVLSRLHGFMKPTADGRREWWKKPEALLVAAALVAGIGSAALSEANREAANAQLIERFSLETVVVASKDLMAGTLLDASNIMESETLKSGVTANQLTPENSANVIGRRLLIDLKAGDPLYLTAVEGGGNVNGIASRIPAGLRLVTLKIADTVAANGWIKPNDHIDVLANLNLPGRGPTTFTLLEDITLVSVGKATVWEEGKSSAGAEIGFYVAPEAVEFISFAEKHGTFSVALRNPKDIKRSGKVMANTGKAGVDMTKFLDHHAVRGASGGGDLPVYVNGEKKEDSK